MDAELWTRLERVATIDDATCACTLTGSWTCGRHATHDAPALVDEADLASAFVGRRGAATDTSAQADPSRWADGAGLADHATFRAVWRVAVVAAAVFTIGSVGFAAARAMSRSGGTANVAGTARPVSLGAVAEAVPPAALRDAPSVDLPPMNLSTPARLGLLGATVGCLAGGLSLGLTRRDRPARQRRVRPGKDWARLGR